MKHNVILALCDCLEN